MRNQVPGMKASSIVWRRAFPDAAPGTDGVAIFDGRVIGRVRHMTDAPRDPKPWSWSVTDPDLAGRPGWADTATLEHGDAIGARLAVREGALPGDVGVGHCHARANFQTGSLVALVSGNGDGPRRTTGTAAAIPGSS